MGGESMSHDLDWAVVFDGSVLFLSMIAATELRRRKIKILHESGAAILIGVIFGAIIWLSSTSITHMLSFNTDLFFLVLLPPIIFHSGFTLNLRMFFANFGAIQMFAVVGTILSAVLMTVMVYFLGLSGIIDAMPITDCLLFGTLISAVDPVSVLSIFEQLHCDFTLSSLVFGESVLNDAVVIVIFRTVQSLSPSSHVDAVFIFSTIGHFFGVFFGSMAIGVFIGLLSSLFFKHAHVRDYPVMESIIVILLGYVPYLIAEALTMSGIVTLLFTGITMSHYSYFNLSRTTRQHSKQVFHILASAAEMFIFGYLGLAVFVVEGHEYHILFIIASIIGCLVTRALHVFPISFLLNLFRKKHISKRNQVVMWWGGLRGAIAFALSIGVTGPHAHSIISTTLVTVGFSAFVLGGLAPLFVKKLKITIEKSPVNNLPDEAPPHLGSMALKWSILDSKYLKPFFTRVSLEGGKRAADRIMRRNTSTAIPRAPSSASLASLQLEDSTRLDGMFSVIYDPVHEYMEQIRMMNVNYDATDTSKYSSGVMPRNSSFLSVVDMEPSLGSRISSVHRLSHLELSEMPPRCRSVGASLHSLSAVRPPLHTHGPVTRTSAGPPVGPVTRTSAGPPIGPVTVTPTDVTITLTPSPSDDTLGDPLNPSHNT